LDDDGRELPHGEVGELGAAGDNIMQGYWRDPQSTAKALSPHGYHTGDLGYRDEDGYFFVVGRKDNQLKVRGHRINTQEIEDVILASGMAVEAVVFGVPDPLLEKRLVAIVVTVHASTDTRDIVTCCAQKMPVYKVPQDVVFVASLPKSASGKLDRKRCEKLLQ
jgi:acyl-coenzyme A synthetase/AMP-(fatty) acid ligase